jgi:hypothetical protein
MHTINLRHLFHLHGCKIALLALALIGLQTAASAQRGGNYNFFDFQQKPYYFGITLGYNSSSFKPFNSSNFLATDSIRVIESAAGPGFNLGIVTNLKMGDNFDFRFLPTLSFAERTINYTKRGRQANLSQRRVESVLVEMPFHLRYKSAPYKDMRLFLIAGVKYAFDVASESELRQAETLVKIAPNEFSVEYGAGVQFFFPFFIFSPELKISHGIGNTLIFNDQVQESTVLEKLLSRTFTISLHFEG